ncbi:MAG: hypothetical protein J6W26_01435 [Bacteroidales bacterium]|nr:hypothetical protein [Bacteroidales bacterium]
MSNAKKKGSRNHWGIQFLISVLGTAIGVGLTFAVSNRMENRKKEEAQRLTAMMVIHDIDETIDQLKKMKQEMESGYDETQYVMEHLDQLDSVPDITVYNTVEYLLLRDHDFRFDMSKEKIFHSSPDTWQNLGSMKFIDNVQSFYFDRQLFQESMNKSDIWREPIPLNEYEKLQVQDDDNQTVEQYLKQYNILIREFLKEKLDDKQVQQYISYSAWRMTELVRIIAEWTNKNNENKFLMSITDEELEDYVNNIYQNGIALKEKSLIGTWSLSSSDEYNSEYEFSKDHVYSMRNIGSSSVNLPFYHGKIKYEFKENGTWKLEGDSLTQCVDLESIDVKIDVSDIALTP